MLVLCRRWLCWSAGEVRNGWKCKGEAMATWAQTLLERKLNQERVASDCPELNCTGCRNKAIMLCLFPQWPPAPCPSSTGGLCCQGNPLFASLGYGALLTAIQNKNKQGLRWSDLINTCVFPLDINNKTALELAAIRTLPLFWTVQGFLRIWISEQQEKTQADLFLLILT